MDAVVTLLMRNRSLQPALKAVQKFLVERARTGKIDQKLLDAAIDRIQMYRITGR